MQYSYGNSGCHQATNKFYHSKSAAWESDSFSFGIIFRYQAIADDPATMQLSTVQLWQCEAHGAHSRWTSETSYLASEQKPKAWKQAWQCQDFSQ